MPREDLHDILGDLALSSSTDDIWHEGTCYNTSYWIVCQSLTTYEMIVEISIGIVVSLRKETCWVAEIHPNEIYTFNKASELIEWLEDIDSFNKEMKYQILKIGETLLQKIVGIDLE